MDAKAAIGVLLAAATALIGGTPLEVALLQVVSGLSRLVTPADVLAAAQEVAALGQKAEEQILLALHELATLPRNPEAFDVDSGPSSGGEPMLGTAGDADPHSGP